MKIMIFKAKKSTSENYAKHTYQTIIQQMPPRPLLRLTTCKVIYTRETKW